MSPKDYLFENNSLIIKNKYPVFKNQLHGFGECCSFIFSACFHKVIQCKRMIYRNDFLGNNWPFIQIVGYEMSRCTYYFHSTFQCLPVRVCTNKGR